MRMHVLTATSVVLTALAASLAYAQNKADGPKDKEEWTRLFGNWVAIKGGAYKGVEVSEEDITKSGHRLVFNGETLSWYTALQTDPILTGTIKLDPTKTPKHLDLTFKRDGQTVVAPCIYELDKDTLKLCYDEGTRPTEFKTKVEAANLKLYVFKRKN